MPQLTALPAADQVAAGGDRGLEAGPHQLTYRQAERTFGLITKALSKDTAGRHPVRRPCHGAG